MYAWKTLILEYTESEGHHHLTQLSQTSNRPVIVYIFHASGNFSRVKSVNILRQGDLYASFNQTITGSPKKIVYEEECLVIWNMLHTFDCYRWLKSVQEHFQS